jgi:predicted RNase H-like HicB family nuclease
MAAVTQVNYKGVYSMVRYPAVIDGEREAYGVIIPDMPGACCAMGLTVVEALDNAEDSLAEFVDLLKEKGEPIPTPSPVDAL